MKKIGIIAVIAAALAVGVIAYKITKDLNYNHTNLLSKSGMNNQISNNNSTSTDVNGDNNNSNSTKDANTANTNNFTNSSSQNNNNNNNSQNSTSIGTDNTKYNQQFEYNIGFNVLFNKYINSNLTSYEPYLINKFKQIYGNYSDVIVNVSNIYLTYSNNNTYVSALYTVTMNTNSSNDWFIPDPNINNYENNSSTAWYQSNIENISVNIGENTTGKLTSTFPSSWDYTTTSVNDNGVTIPSGTSFINMNTKDGQNMTMYFPSYEFKGSKLVTIYPTLSSAKTNVNPIATNVNTDLSQNNKLFVIGIIDGYVEVGYTNSNGTTNIGYIKFDGSGLNLLSYPRQALGVQTKYNRYDSTNYTISTPQPYILSSNCNILEYPCELSKTLGTLQANQAVDVLTNSFYPYTLVYSNGILGFVKSSNISNQNATGSNYNTPYPTYNSANTFANPIGYKLTLKGLSGEGSYQGLLDVGMNREFDGTGDTVIATDTGGSAGMMHYSVNYNVTYTTPDGKTVTKKNQEIQGLTNPDSGSSASQFV